MGNPLTVRETLDEETARKPRLPTANKGVRAVVFSAPGRRDDSFVRVDRGLYDLAHRRPDLAGNANGGRP